MSSRAPTGSSTSGPKAATPAARSSPKARRRRWPPSPRRIRENSWPKRCGANRNTLEWNGGFADGPLVGGLGGRPELTETHSSGTAALPTVRSLGGLGGARSPPINQGDPDMSYGVVVGGGGKAATGGAL